MEWRKLFRRFAVMLVSSSLSSISCSGMRTQSNQEPGISLTNRAQIRLSAPMAAQIIFCSNESGTVRRGRPPN